MEAGSHENIAEANCALEAGRMPIGAGDSGMRTALHLACSNGHLAMAKLEDKSESKRSPRDRNKSSPLAAAHDSPTILETLNASEMHVNWL